MSDDLIQVQRNTDDRSISDLLGELYRDALQVISLEIEFAKTEMS